MIDTIGLMPDMTRAQLALRREADKASRVLEQRMAGKSYRVMIGVVCIISYDSDGHVIGTVVAEDSLHTEAAAMDAAALHELTEMDLEDQI